MIKFREHRGSLEDAMKTLVEVPDTFELEAHLRTVFLQLADLPSGSISIIPYMMERDDRIGWENTCQVVDRFRGTILGFCEMPL